MRIITLLSTLLTLPAFAGDDETVEAQYKAVTEIDMGSIDLTATLIKPEVASISESKRPVFAPMIHLRTDFKHEMRESLLTLP